MLCGYAESIDPLSFATQLRQFRADPSCIVGVTVGCANPVSGDSLDASFIAFDSKESTVTGAAPSLTLYHH